MNLSFIYFRPNCALCSRNSVGLRNDLAYSMSSIEILTMISMPFLPRLIIIFFADTSSDDIRDVLT